MISYHIIKVVGPASVQNAVQDALQNNEDETWSDQRLGLDYSRVSADGLKEFVKNQERENSKMAATGFRSVQIEEEEIQGRGRLRAVARAVNEALGNATNDVVSPQSGSPRRARGRPARAVATHEDGDESDGEPTTKKSNTGRGRGRPAGSKKKETAVKSSGNGTGKRGRPPKAQIAEKAEKAAGDEEEEAIDEVESTGEVQDDDE